MRRSWRIGSIEDLSLFMTEAIVSRVRCEENDCARPDGVAELPRGPRAAPDGAVARWAASARCLRLAPYDRSMIKIRNGTNERTREQLTF